MKQYFFLNKGMDYFLEEAAGLRKTRAGSAEAPRAPRPPTSLPVVRARQSTRQRESTAVGRSPQSTPRASVARSVGFDTCAAACARHVAPPRPARPRGSRLGRHAPWLPEHQPPGAPSRGEAGAGQGTARTPQVLGSPLGAPRPAAGPPTVEQEGASPGLGLPRGADPALCEASDIIPCQTPAARQLSCLPRGSGKGQGC